MSCLFGGYKFASVLRCVGLVKSMIEAKWWMKKIKHLSVDIYSIYISLMMMINIRLVLHACVSDGGKFPIFLSYSSYYVHPPGGWIYYFCFFRRPMSGVRRPMSGVTHGFRSFKGKVLELLSPNLVCRLIGSVACLGLLLAVVPLLLTE